MSQCSACTCRGSKNRLERHRRDGFEVQLYFDFINSRLKVKEFSGNDTEGLSRYIINVARDNKLGKILFNAGEGLKPVLEGAGYVLEGIYPGFFNGVDAYGYSFFTDNNRKKSPYLEKEEEILRAITDSTRNNSRAKSLPEGLSMRVVTSDDVQPVVELYRKIFSTYPSPLLDTGYVTRVMNSHVLFVAVFKGDRPVSAASADMDLKNKNAEITDCATLPEYRGKGLLTHLIKYLEKAMKGKRINCLYSLARAGSYGMNASLYNLNYRFTGRFINNCHIGGRYEDMNLWVKKTG